MKAITQPLLASLIALLTLSAQTERVSRRALLDDYTPPVKREAPAVRPIPLQYPAPDKARRSNAMPTLWPGLGGRADSSPQTMR